jgi:drug/metabolite transporter (DMT)-like permease
MNLWRQLNQRISHHPRQAAIGFMLLSTLGFSLMNICVRLATEVMDAGLVVSLRNGLTLLIVIPLCMTQGFSMLRTTRLKEHFRRSFIGVIGMMAWTYCLTLMPLTHATALSFTAPLLATLFAVVFLKEQVTPRQMMGLGVGVLGVLIILRPGVSEFDWSMLLVIFATTAWAITTLLIKSLAATEPPLRMVFYMNLFMFFVGLPLGFRHWIWPDAHGWLLIAGVSVCSIFMHFMMVKAYALAPVTALMPLDFMRLVYTSILAYFIFGETSDVYTWIGAAVIIASVVVVSSKRVPPELAEPV